MSSNISKLLALSGLQSNPKNLISIKVKTISYNTITCCNTTDSAQSFVSLPGCKMHAQQSCQTHTSCRTPKGSPGLGYFGSIYYPCQTLKLIISGPDIFSGEHSQRLPFRNSNFLLSLYMDLLWQLSVSSTYWGV